MRLRRTGVSQRINRRVQSSDPLAWRALAPAGAFPGLGQQRRDVRCESCRSARDSGQYLCPPRVPSHEQAAQPFSAGAEQPEGRRPGPRDTAASAGRTSSCLTSNSSRKRGHLHRSDSRRRMLRPSGGPVSTRPAAAFRPYWTAPRSAQQSPRRRPRRSPGTSPCSPACSAQAEAGPLAGSWSAGRSGKASFAATSVCRTPRCPARSRPSSDGRCARTGGCQGDRPTALGWERGSCPP